MFAFKSALFLQISMKTDIVFFFFQANIKTWSGLLVVSFLLNIVLLFTVFYMYRKVKLSKHSFVL